MSRDEQDRAAQRKLIEEALLALAEHFDSVRIFATCPHSDGEPITRHIDMGRGNWFAQFGQVKEWVIAMEERVREGERKGKAEEE